MDEEKNMNKSRRNGAPSILPQDLTFEIFSRLPVKSVMRFRCLSRFYNSLVSQSDFVDIHGRRSFTRSGGSRLLVRAGNHVYFVEQNEDGESSLLHVVDFGQLYDSLGSDNYLECVNGLLLFSSRWFSHPAVVCNPCTRQIKFLPSIEVNPFYFHYSLGFEPEQKIYKVLFMCCRSLFEMQAKSWVLSLGIDESWRQIGNAPMFNQSKEGVCIDGIIYMLTWRVNNMIVAFDVKAETFRTILLWEALPQDDYNLIEIEGNLALLKNKMLDGEISLWVLGKNQHEGWQRQVILGFSPVDDGALFSCYYDGELAMVTGVNCDNFSYLCYDSTRNVWRVCEVRGTRGKDSISGIYKCVETLYAIGKKIEPRPVDRLERILTYLLILCYFVMSLPVWGSTVLQMYWAEECGFLVLLSFFYVCLFFVSSRFCLRELKGH